MNNQKSYYAVIFTSMQTETVEGYSEMADQMEALAKKQDGFLGIESARSSVAITVSYWENLDVIKKWKANTEHLFAQQKGRELWYNWYKVRICKVEREYDFEK
ncbi:antibiotic biosynthesis monooxygenase [Winogradskyella sp. PC-19]|uniref:antibiotic biosynthesis monooxygenase family protein n=1 Tax=Winogradskyella sp. PC-19 TaxID=754417 RepID=UPI000B3CA753|nr:antibiotic biosynthesis monooxygenase [Winogradskyella sp. PC-19]ARV10763.1 antibiotic biosynthesis monooxygenase [Winogradskyella sp. PC-19]